MVLFAVSMHLKLSHKALIVVLIPVFFELAFVCVLIGLLRQAEYETWREGHSKAVIADSNDLIKVFYDSSMALMNYAITRNVRYSESFDKISEQIPHVLRALEILVSSDPTQRDAFQRVHTAGYDAYGMLRDSRKKVDDTEQQLSLTSASHSRRVLQTRVNDLITEIHKFVQEEKKVEELAPYAQARSRQMIVVCLFGGIAINVVLAVALALLINKGITERLQVLMQNTSRLVKKEPLNPLVGGTDEIAHLDSVFHDMAHQLSEAARHKQELVSMVSHDLRSPLMSVQASLALLSVGALGNLPDAAKKETTIAESNVNRLIRLINDLLDVERMEAGKLEIFRSSIAVADVFESALDAVHAYAESKQIELVAETTEAKLHGDGDRIVQVLVNLLSNAIKFSPAGSQVKLVCDESNFAYKEIRVIDQGPGIAPDLREKIFDRFQQVGTKESKSGGTGLGLAICKWIVLGHNGEIGVNSRVGEGSCFWFRIPTADSG